jgi:hypothetical protein
MNKTDLSIATISRARNREEEQLLRTSLEALAALQVPVFITDGGSSESFIHFLHSLPHFSVSAAKGLWPQAKRSITAAGKAGAKAVLYTEPDKLQFFQQHLSKMLAEKEITAETGVILASRSTAGFASFPLFQQMTERTINACCREIVGLETDYCYGPFLFNSRLIAALDFLPDNCGWGWRPALFATAHRTGLGIDTYTGDFFCPPDQRLDHATERIYRMTQLTQNIEGLVLATTVVKDR